MPLYEFHCDTCDADFEKRVGVDQRNTRQICPICNSSENTRRKFSPPTQLVIAPNVVDGSLKKAHKMLDYKAGDGGKRYY